MLITLWTCLTLNVWRGGEFHIILCRCSIYCRVFIETCVLFYNNTKENIFQCILHGPHLLWHCVDFIIKIFSPSIMSPIRTPVLRSSKIYPSRTRVKNIKVFKITYKCQKYWMYYAYHLRTFVYISDFTKLHIKHGENKNNMLPPGEYEWKQINMRPPGEYCCEKIIKLLRFH